MNISNLEIIDKNFNESMFITRVNNIITKLFNGIMLQNIDDVRHNISDDVYNYAANIINDNKNKNLRRMYDELNIKSTDITNIYIDEIYYNIEVIVVLRYLDYYIKLDSGKYVSGDNKNRIIKNYRLLFKKKRKTNIQKNIRYCTNCGKALDINNSGKCDYCNTFYNTEKYDYILESIEEL